MTIAYAITDGWMLALKLGGSAYAAGLFTGLAMAVVVANRVLEHKSER